MDSEELKGWLDMWEGNYLPWQLSFVHQAIEQQAEILMTSPEANSKIFVPLCGKTLDIKFLADLGNDVVGVEASEIAVKDFFTEHNIEYTTKDVPSVKGKLFQSNDHKIKIYCCDLFLFSADIESGFSGIWDRGAYDAMLPEDRERYTRVIKTLVHPGIGYLLEMPDRDLDKGPPFCVPVDVVEKDFGPGCSVVKLLEVTKNPPDFKTVSDLKGVNVFRLSFQQRQSLNQTKV
ncbi:probable thiopurine S-methyltransferase [Argopecten irradians]|uniref:probable thiopurine S-methyltransferase n=1 Tax=Argopecten irradians TaxID=31199 RepID=UPI003713A412